MATNFTQDGCKTFMGPICAPSPESTFLASDLLHDLLFFQSERPKHDYPKNTGAPGMETPGRFFQI